MRTLNMKENKEAGISQNDSKKAEDYKSFIDEFLKGVKE